MVIFCLFFGIFFLRNNSLYSRCIILELLWWRPKWFKNFIRITSIF